MKTALIIGSGLDTIATVSEWSQIDTPFGTATAGKAVFEDREIWVLRRHGLDLNIPPHLINYRANISALKKLGVSRVIATAAVGSLRPDLPPGSFAVTTDFIDFTRRRETTFYHEIDDRVHHVDMTNPYCPQISGALVKSAQEMDLQIDPSAVYICTDGPRYETPAEIRMFVNWGADVVGMTGVPEVILARELGICYGTLAIVTNYAAGISQFPLSHNQVIEQIRALSVDISEVLAGAISLLYDSAPCCSSD